MVPALEQLSLALLRILGTAALQFASLTALEFGGQVTTGAVVSVTVMVWLQVTELLCVSVAVLFRPVLLICLPLTVRTSSAKVVVRLLSQASLNRGVPKTGVAGHSIVASVGQLATVGAALSSTVMVWLQVTALLCASVAVQVRLVLLTCLPLIASVSSAKVTVKLASQVSLNSGVPKTGVAGHPIVASAGQLATVGGRKPATSTVVEQVARHPLGLETETVTSWEPISKTVVKLKVSAVGGPPAARELV